MTKDLLYQPPVFGVCEEIYYQLITEGKQTEEQLSKYYIGSDDDINTYLTPLEDLKLIRRENDLVEAVPGLVMRNWDRKEESYTTYFKLQLLSSITTATEKEIQYFAIFLSNILHQVMVSDADLDVSMQAARKEVGLDDKKETTLSAKIGYSKQILRYLGMTYQHQVDSENKTYEFLFFPQELLKLSLELVAADLREKKTAEYFDLYSDVFLNLTQNYCPTLNKDNEVLKTIGLSLRKNAEISKKFTYLYTPDGGKSFPIQGTEYNTIHLEGEE